MNLGNILSLGSNNMFFSIDLSIFVLTVFLSFLIASVSRYILGAKIMGTNVFVVMVLVLVYFYPTSTLLSLIIGVPVLLMIYLMLHYLSLFLRNFIYHYGSRVSLIVLFNILIVTLILNFYSVIANNFSFFPKAESFYIFISLSLIYLVDIWIKYQIQIGFKRSLFSFLITLCIASISSLVFSSAFFIDLINGYEYFVLILTTILIILTGRYKGFRLSEYLRFYPIFVNKKKNV